MKDGIEFCWSDNGVLLSEGRDGVIEPCYIIYVEELSTGKQWRNPDYLGSRRARCSTAIMTAPSRWKTVG
eukprot:4377436-Pyramimonas_sp.AAC.1